MEFSKWEEDVYWTHFKHLHFSQFLNDDFHEQLAIPKKFSAKKKLPDCVTLKGPGGGTWKVGVATVDNSEFFKHGWPEFVNDHVFGENDLLVFKYNGESLFEVLIFNGQTLCGKEASYFAKRRDESKNNLVGSLLKRKLGETSCDNIDTTCSENAGFASPEKSGDDNIIILPTEEQVNTPTTSETGDRKLTGVHLVRNYRNTVVQESPRDVQMQPVVKNDAKRTPRRWGTASEYRSNRRPITEDEKSNARMLAEAEILKSNKGGLLVVMKPSYVYKRYHVPLPLSWVLKKNMTLKNQDFYLRYGEEEWRTRFNYYQSRKCTGITSGWKRFAVDNNLEQFDVCIFDPCNREDGPFCVDVKIFRVVPEVTCLTPVESPNSGKSGRKSSKSVEIDDDQVDED